MNQHQTLSVNAPIITGTAMVAADAALTVLFISDSLYAYFGKNYRSKKHSYGTLYQSMPLSIAERLRHALSSDDTEFSCEESFCKNGVTKSVHVSAARMSGLLHKQKQPIYYLVFSDISELTEMRRITDFEKKKYNIIADITEDISFEYDFATDTMSYAEKYQTVFGTPAVISHFRQRLSKGDSIDTVNDFFKSQFITMDVPVSDSNECHVRTADGTQRWFSLFCTTLLNETMLPEKAVGAIRNIDRQKREQIRLLDKSRTDAMTGLLNKTTTEEEIRNSLADVHTGSMGVLMMIDIDNFKIVNDTLGHLAGDAVIIQLAHQLQHTFRNEDIVGRVGGDEFHVFMRHVTDIAAVYEKAQGLCASVHTLFNDHECGAPITISMGIACSKQPTPYSELFRQADVALYSAKANGKNRYAFFGNASSGIDQTEHLDPANAINQPLATPSPLTARTLRNSIVADIIDTLFSMHDMRQGIDKTLTFIGNTLNLGSILIYEKSVDFKTISITHEWTAKEAWCTKAHCQNVPIESIQLPKPAVPGGIYYCSDIHALPPEERTFTKDPAVTSLLQCDIERENMVVGVISFEDREKKRLWTQQEIDALILMSKLISGHISQKQSAILLRQSNEATRDILNSLPGAYVCVISKATHRLLYFNNRVNELFSKVTLGMVCHKIFMDRDTPCDVCPNDNPYTEQSCCTLMYDVPFGKVARISVSNILWENREPAYVALISEYEPSTDEREQQKKKEAYAQALCNTYDYVLDIDCHTKHFEQLTLSKGQYNPFPLQSMYPDIHTTIAQTYLYPDDCEEYTERFDLNNMRCAFANNAPSVEMEYRSVYKTTQPYWKSRIALPYTLDDGSSHILIFAHDITEQKELELRSHEEEANYYAALKGSYIEIQEIDLQADTSRIIFCKIPLPESLNLTGSFASDMQLVANHCVHPDDKAAFLQFFQTQSLLSRLKDGRKLLQEYRLKTSNGSYRWLSELVLPLPGASTSKILVLSQDITERKRMENANQRLEQRYNAVFKQSCDALTEINLITEEFSRIQFTTSLFTTPQHDKYSATFTELLKYVHPDDRETVRQQRSIGALRRVFESGSAGHICEYRISSDISSASSNFQADNSAKVYIWTESRIFFITEEGVPTAFILSRDISTQKQVEEERNIESQRFTLALRDTYTEIYEYNLNTNISRLLFTNSARLMPVGVNDLIDTRTIVATAVHPDDQEHVASNFSGSNLRLCFEQGDAEVIEEFRRLGKDGDYHWISAVVVPLRESSGTISKAMLLVKDISQRKAQEQQQRVTEQYTLALRNIYDELYEFNVTQNTYHMVYHAKNKYVAPAHQGLLSESIPLVASIMIHPDDQARFLDFFYMPTVRADFAQGQEYRVGEFRKFLIDDTFHWASFTMFPVASEKGGEEIYLVFIMDIDTRKQAEGIAQQNILLERQRVADERYRIIVDQTNTLVFEWNREGDQRYISSELQRRFAGAYDQRELMHIWRDDGVIHPEDMPVFEQFLSGSHSNAHTEMTVRFRRRDNSYIWCKVVITCLRDKLGLPYRYIGTLNDVNAATCSVMALRYRAEYDTLTGVYNMQAFHSHATQLLLQHPERRYSIIRMDVDRFKVINDLYGMEEGDRLLKAIASLFIARMTEYSVCGHISGDIFCACVDFSTEKIIAFVHEITEALTRYPLTSRIIPSFGICRVDNTETPINVLCDWANLALKTVKGNVFISHAFYDETLRDRILDEKKIENEMHNSLVQREFQLYLQPKVHIPSSRVVGCECLVRWMHPSHGIIPPDNFIPLFEKNGFIIRLDEYVWEQTCVILRSWLDRGFPLMPISVNVSRMHIHDTRLCEKLITLMEKYNLPPSMLELELTENVFLDSDQQLFDSIKELQKCGFLFSLDDFGSGYSSLNMLKSLPIKIIKIDRGFLNEVVATDRGRIIIQHTIALSKALNIQVIAEGVENAEQAAFLMDAGCSMAQGYYYSPPVPLNIFEDMAFRDKVLLVK